MDQITQLICNKNKISYITFDKNYKIIKYNDFIIDVSDNSTSLQIGSDIRDVMWELIGIEDDLQTLYHDKNKKISFPMILKKNIYYDLDIETYKDEHDTKLFIAYLLQKPLESVSYINMIKEINKKTLIYENEDKDNAEKYYNLINERLLSFNVDLDGIILNVNSAFTYFFNLPQEEIVGKHFSYYFKARDLSLTKEKTIIFNATNIKKETISFHADIIPVSRDAQIYENIIICQDINSLKQIEQKLEYAAGHDALTGLPNRSQILNKIDHSINKCDDSQTSFVICCINIDDFNTVNTNYGHHAGDMLLKHLAKILSDFVRKDDVVARVGGDDFIILFDALSEENSINNMIERLKELTHKQPLIYTQEDSIEYDFSLGLALYPNEAKSVQELIKIADKALFLNKKSKK